MWNMSVIGNFLLMCAIAAIVGALIVKLGGEPESSMAGRAAGCLAAMCALRVCAIEHKLLTAKGVN